MRWPTSACIVLALVLSSQAQRVSTAPVLNPITKSSDDYLEIGSTTLRLGMPKNMVISELASQYEVQQSSSAIWLAKDKKDSSNVYAAVTFDKNGQLFAATKYWLPENRVYKPEDVVVAIYGIIDGFIKQGNKTCVIGDGEHNSPGPVSETKTVFVRCGPKFLEIDLLRLTDAVSVGVSEVLMENEPKLQGY